MSYNLSEKRARTKVLAEARTIEKMLDEVSGDYADLIKTETLEANLEDGRWQNDSELTEGQLDSRHTGAEAGVTEAKLDNEKSMFSNHRVETKGDVPKLEEQRLSNNPVEEEKFEKANK
jgi:hypothetical protein